ncbi:hypothetical protein CsSME_00025739 [Camellia sinensis var. sinensis]
MPRNPLKFESCIEIASFFPPRILESELISSTAAFMAILATFPLMVLNVNIAPIFTTSGGFETASENVLTLKRIGICSINSSGSSQAKLMMMTKINEPNHKGLSK